MLALTPCPYEFKFNYETEDGAMHRAKCDDWETAAMFYRFARDRSTATVLVDMKRVFNDEYPVRILTQSSR